MAICLLFAAPSLAAAETLPSLEALMPDTFHQLTQVLAKLEGRYRDMQDVEFTVQDGKLWMLQTRSGKRTVKAALKIATDLTAERLIDEEEAVMRIDANALDQLLHPPPVPLPLVIRPVGQVRKATNTALVHDPPGDRPGDGIAVGHADNQPFLTVEHARVCPFCYHGSYRKPLPSSRGY